MMAGQFHDPRLEYTRQCPYCLEYITVNHMNRLFCPEKNGIKDFCKNRYKRLKKNLMSQGVILDYPDAKPLKIVLSNDLSARKKTIDDTIHESILIKNKKILESFLGTDDCIELEISKLKRVGYEMDFFDAQLDNPAGLPLHKIGRYAMTYLDDKRVCITLLKLIEV